MSLIAALASLASIAFVQSEPRVTQDIYFLRHAETVANATSKYNSSTLNAISEKGQQQIVQATADLKRRRYDAIFVSPSARALKTVAPYLRDTRQTAAIWPELYECCHERGAARKIPAGRLRFGAKVEVPSVISRYFTLVPGRDRYVGVSNYQEGLRQVKLCAAEVRKLGPGSVLLVGHSLQGSRLFKELLGRESMIEFKNGKILHLQRLEGGSFRIAPRTRAVR
jgi:broad specificity phosphatase PhoE